MGDACDNAMAESFFASLERELIERRTFAACTETRMAVVAWIVGWFNPRRPHSELGYRSSANYDGAQ